MTTRMDPISGNFTGGSGSFGGPGICLNDRQRELVDYHDQFAEDLLPLINQRKSYFTAYTIRQMPVALEPLVDAGIITKHKSEKHDGHYYKTVPGLTRVFCMCALVRRDERRRAMAERTGGSNPG